VTLLLGCGALSSVYEAFDRARNQRVAIKVVPLVHGAMAEVITHEFEVLRGITHPNVRRVHELFVGVDDIAFSAELIEGTSLSEYVRPFEAAMDRALEERALEDTLDGDLLLDVTAEERRPCEPVPPRRIERLCDAFAQLVSGLHELHLRGIVHGEVKPSNVMATVEGRIVLLDLGLSVGVEESFDAALTRSGRLVGRQDYWAPEVMRGARVSAATDFYSVGTMLFEALTGRLPFSGLSTLDVIRRTLHEPPPRPSALVPRLPEDLDRLCVALLDRDPAKRPPCEEILRILRAVAPARPDRMGGWTEATFEGTKRFAPLRTIWQGGHPTTCEVFDRARGEHVWVKAIPRTAGNPGALVHEYKTLRRLASAGPHVLQVHELFVGADDIAFSSERLDGALLGHDSRPEPDPARLRRVMAQLVLALDAVHQGGVVHRDVKPSHVFVTPEQRLVLLGFELAVPTPEAGKHDDLIAGTPAYMAPEVVRREPATEATDFYAVGAMLFEALTGRLPFEGGAGAMLGRKVAASAPAPSEVAQGVPEDLDRLCVALLDRDPAKRPGAEAILQVLGV
jgi:serine/threonine protein kinase